MGNHGSKRKFRRPKCTYGTTDDDTQDDERNPIEDLEGTTPASYDKLIACMIEMADSDDADLSSPSFVEHLTALCAEKHHITSTPAPSIRQNSLEVPSVPFRQHSLESSGSSRYTKSSRSGEDLLKPRPSLRRAVLSRQSTVDYSDESDIPADVMGRSFDSEPDVANPETILLNNMEETSFSNNLFRPPLRKNKSCTTYQNCHASLANLLSTQSKNKSKSLMTMRKLLSETRNDDEITPIAEENVMTVLDDDMLDRNIADILYSVEALWPKTPNMSLKSRYS